VSRPSDGTMTLVEHLGELRRRVIICVIAVVLGAVVVFFLYTPILRFLSGPYRELTVGDTGCGGTANSGCDLIVTGPLQPFMVRMKIAGYGGAALAVPVVFWEIWRFVTPALRRNERRYGLLFGLAAIVLFLLGAVAAWFTIGETLSFLFGMGGDTLQPFVAADSYLTLVALMLLAFGTAFELPLLVLGLLLARVVTTVQLRRARRWVVVGITVFAAVITPSQDPVSLLFMAVPMYVLYELAILIGRLLKR